MAIFHRLFQLQCPQCSRPVDVSKPLMDQIVRGRAHTPLCVKCRASAQARLTGTGT